MRAIISGRLLTSKEAQPQAKPFEIRDTRLRGFVLRVQPSGVRVYYAQLSRIKRERIGDVSDFTPDEAREHCTVMLGNFANGRDTREGLPGRSIQPAVKPGATLGEYMEASYAPYQRGEFRSAETTIKRIKQLFGDWYELPLSAITPKLIDEWKAARSGKVSKATLMRDLQTLSGVLQHACDVGSDIQANPMRKVSKPKLDRSPKVRFLDAHEEGRLREVLEARDAAKIAGRERTNEHRRIRGRKPRPSLRYFGDHMTPVVLLTMNTGLRRGELARLMWEDILLDDDAQAMLTVRGDIAKSGQSRHIHLNEEARDVMRKWREQCGLDADQVFPQMRTARTAWRLILKRSKIKRFRFHDLRHHFASRLAQLGASLYSICTLLGHADIKTTLLYAHLSPNEGSAAVELLKPRKLASASSV